MSESTELNSVEDDNISLRSDEAQHSDNEIVSQASDNAFDNVDDELAGNMEVDDEDDDHTFWIETFDVPAMIPTTALSSPRIASKHAHNWKGVDWSLLAVVNNNRAGDLTLFLGFNSSVGLSPNWAIPLKFTIYLLGEDDKPYLEHSLENEFRPNVKNPNDRVDCGSWNKWRLSDVVSKNKALCPTTPTVLRVKVVMEEQFSPRRVDKDYDSKKETDMVGLENLGATCYLNALLQMLYHINSFRKAVYKLPHAEEVLKTSTTLALQSVFKGLQFSKKEVSTRDLTVAFGWTSAESFMQQDVQEMMRVLIDKLEEKMANTVVDGVTKQLFAGKVRSFIKCVNVEYVSQREEDFYDIQLDVKGCRDIHDSFRKYTESEKLDGDNQYAAEGFGKQDADKGVIFTKFPPVLTIHLKRFDFNMMTMGFTKIHDHYQFPLRLELDQYLAEDSPAESRSVPNVYILHSVLVHAGDVGGGHYYAYIRPTSSGFNYSKPVAQQQHKDKQWFKFNDEQVMLVREREAVEHCYGRKEGESQSILKGGMSSAYMLVYIRESDAGEIMGEVRPEDIPSDLVTRLDTEMKEQMVTLRKAERDDMMRMVRYATEDDVRNFSAFSRYQDFLRAEDLPSIQVMSGSSRLYLLLALAKELSVDALKIRLWRIDSTSTLSTLRVTEDVVSAKDLKKTLGEHQQKYFVQFLTETQPDEVTRKFEDLKEREASWLDCARELIVQDLENCGCEVPSDPASGLGIGSSNKLLVDVLIRLGDAERHMEMVDSIKQLTSEMLELLCEVVECRLGDKEVLVFLKAFDPVGSIQTESSAPRHMFIEDLNSCDDNEEPESPSSDDLAVCAPEEYMPMKYVGYMVMQRDITLPDFFALVVRILREYVGTLEDYWLNPDALEVFHAVCPTKMYRVELTDEEEEKEDKLVVKTDNTLEHYVEQEAMGLFVVSCVLHSDENDFLVPEGTEDACQWLAYRARRREFVAKPLFARDEQIVARCQERIWRNGLAKHSHSGNSNEAVNGNNKRTAGDTHENDLHSNGIVFKPTASFAFYASTTTQLSALAQRLQEHLLINARYLAFHIVPFESDPEEVEDTTPCSLALDIDVQKLIVHHKYPNNPKSKFAVYYQVSPFPLCDAAGNDMKSHAIFLVHITDARLRSWRQLYLAQCGGKLADSDSSTNVSNRSSPTKDNAATAVATDSPQDGNKRRRVTTSDHSVDQSISVDVSESVLDKAQWPNHNHHKYNIDEVGKVFARVGAEETFQAVTRQLRDQIGIPLNMHALVSNTHYMSAPRDLDAWESGEAAVTAQVRNYFSMGHGAVVSEDLSPSVADEDDELDREEELGATTPVLPLVVCELSGGIISKVINRHILARKAPHSWFNSSEIRSSLSILTVQHVSLLDMLFMTNKHPRIRSMVVSVFSFTLLGNVVQPCAVDQFGGPFLAYLREDDDHDSFCARLRAVSGDSEEDLDRCRLAVVKHRQPTFIRRPATGHLGSRLGSTDSLNSFVTTGMDLGEDDPQNAAPGQQRQKREGGVDTLWEALSAKYPAYLENDFSSVVGSARTLLRGEESCYPLIGIQRRAADANANKSQRTTKSIRIV